MNFKSIIIALAVASATIAAHAETKYTVAIDHAETARINMGYNIARIDHAVCLDESEVPLVTEVLKREADKIAVIQANYTKTGNLDKTMHDITDLNIATALELAAVLRPEQAHLLRPYFDERRLAMLSSVDAIINGYWAESAAKAGINVNS